MSNLRLLLNIWAARYPDLAKGADLAKVAAFLEERQVSPFVLPGFAETIYALG
jgi:hypothetical protein